ncbi:hypothetical protein ES703_97094 [subsurface metagenome]
MPHHLQNFSVLVSLLPHREHDFAVAGVVMEGVPICLPSIFPPQLVQNLESGFIGALQRLHFWTFSGAVVGVALYGEGLVEGCSGVFSFSFF